MCKKAAHETLMKFTTGVNFINTLRATFVPIFLRQKITKPKCNYRKAVQSIFVQKILEYELMKLIPGRRDLLHTLAH
jgi:hypothetical protein